MVHAPLVPSPLRCGYSTDGEGESAKVRTGTGTGTLYRARSEVGMRGRRGEDGT